MTKRWLLAAITAAGVGFASQSMAQESASPEEIIAKTKEAAAVVSSKGDAGLAEISQKDGPWAWKDTYVFAYDCDQGVVTAHPNPDLIGKNINEIKDKKGNAFWGDLCVAGQQANGGWAEYYWTKPGVEGVHRKITFAIQAEGTSQQVAAGVYDESISVEELNAMVK